MDRINTMVTIYKHSPADPNSLSSNNNGIWTEVALLSKLLLFRHSRKPVGPKVFK